MFSEVQNSSGTPAQRYSLNGETMGTRYSAVFLHRRVSMRLQSMPSCLPQWTRWIDKCHLEADSDLSRLNAAPVQQWLTMPPSW
jgi:hypothetical protein